ncbi:hypothetical protein Dimus_001610, partial [Dionaea muscipula]
SGRCEQCTSAPLLPHAATSHCLSSRYLLVIAACAHRSSFLSCEGESALIGLRQQRMTRS